jgi:hypothetical protein
MQGSRIRPKNILHYPDFFYSYLANRGSVQFSCHVVPRYLPENFTLAFGNSASGTKFPTTYIKYGDKQFVNISTLFDEANENDTLNE